MVDGIVWKSHVVLNKYRTLSAAIMCYKTAVIRCVCVCAAHLLAFSINNFLLQPISFWFYFSSFYNCFVRVCSMFMLCGSVQCMCHSTVRCKQNIWSTIEILMWTIISRPDLTFYHPKILKTKFNWKIRHIVMKSSVQYFNWWCHQAYWTKSNLPAC